MNEARRIGDFLPATVGQTGAMEPQRLGTDDWSLERMRTLPARLDDATMMSLEAVASSPLPSPQPCSERHFNQCFAMVDAALPKRSQDDKTGEILVRTYRRMLGHLTREAISFIAEEAIATCKWFPTIAECLEISRRFTQPPHPFRQVRTVAAQLLSREKHERFKEAVKAVEAGKVPDADIADLPERWRGIMAEWGVIWALRDGTFTRRPMDDEERKARAAELLAAGLL